MLSEKINNTNKTSDEYIRQKIMRHKILQEVSENTTIFVLVTTAKALLLVNLNTKEVIPIEFNRPEYYGISWFPDGEDLVLSHSQIDPDHITLAEYAVSEVGIVSFGSLNTPGFLSQPHQIFCASDGRVICTNTGRNAIAVVNIENNYCIQETRISSARWDRLSLYDTPGDHINSVFEKNDLLYVMAHGWKKGSVLATFTYPDLNLISLEPLEGCLHLHNIFVTDEGQRISCGSENGELIELGKTASVLWDAGTPVFTRGIAASKELLLIGESQRAFSKELRTHSMSGMWLLDRRTWKAIDYFCLGSYGGVHDVRLVNIPDEAHHGHVFRGLENLLMQDIREVAAVEKIKMSHFSKNNKNLLVVNVGDEIIVSSQKRELFIQGWSKNENNNEKPDTFYEKKLALINGWSEIENTCVWSNSESATFMVLTEKLPEKFKLELSYIGFVVPAHTKQSYEFWTAQGQFLQKCEIEYGEGVKKVVVDIHKCEHENNNHLTIVIKILNPVSPLILKHSKDPRLLGFGLQSIKVLSHVDID